MNELMSRMTGSEKVANCKKEPDANKEDFDSHNETFETAHGSSLESFKSADVVESPKPAVKEVEIFSSDDHSSNPEIASSNENDSEEPEKPEEPAARGEGDAGTVTVVEETKSDDGENLETIISDLDDTPQQEVVTEEKEVQTKLIVRSFLFIFSLKGSLTAI